MEEVGDTTSHWFGKNIQANEMLAQLLFLDVWMNVSLCTENGQISSMKQWHIDKIPFD